MTQTTTDRAPGGQGVSRKPGRSVQTTGNGVRPLQGGDADDGRWVGRRDGVGAGMWVAPLGTGP